MTPDPTHFPISATLAGIRFLAYLNGEELVLREPKQETGAKYG